MSVWCQIILTRITAEGEIPQEMLVVVWDALYSRTTNSDAETKHRSQCACKTIGHGLKTQTGREMKQIWSKSIKNL